jgi:L-rhamnose isomerase/sugar isomerase
MFENYLSAMEQVYAALPPDMAMFIEHKMYEPAFYSTVISDWGSSLMAAQALGRRPNAWWTWAITRRT